MSKPGCGCDPPSLPVQRTPEPVACTLAANDQPRRAADFRAAFAHLVSTEPFDGGFRWTFRPEPGLVGQLVSLAEREHACCRFFDFRVFAENDAVIWETRAEPHAAAVVDEFMRLPQALAGSGDDATLKRTLEAAGLTFVSDAADGTG